MLAAINLIKATIKFWIRNYSKFCQVGRYFAQLNQFVRIPCLRKKIAKSVISDF